MDTSEMELIASESFEGELVCIYKDGLTLHAVVNDKDFVEPLSFLSEEAVTVFVRRRFNNSYGKTKEEGVDAGK